MDLSVGLVFVLVLLLASFVLRKKQNLPPGYWGVPFIGSLSLLRKLKDDRPHVVLADESKALGRIFRFYIGQQLVVVLSGYDIIHEALVGQKEVFSGRVLVSVKALQAAFSDDVSRQGIILKQYDKGWRTARRFTLQALRDFGVGKSSLETKINEELVAAENVFDSLNGEPTSVSDLMQKIISNVIYSIVYGKRYDFEDPEFYRLRRLMNVFVSGAGVVSPTSFLPDFLARLVDRKEDELDVIRGKALMDIRDYVFKEIEEHENTFDESNIRDLVDLCIQTSRSGDSELKECITKTNLFRIIVDLFVAGSETTSTALNWAFLCLVEFPEVQKRCRDEIFKELGDKTVEYSDRSQLPYVNAVIMEIQRIGHIVPMNVPHLTLSDCQLDGYDIPKDTLIIPSLYSVSMDEKYFPDPHKFNPDRFIDDRGNLIKNDAAIPFSVGPRVCLGEPLARMELFLVLTNLLQKFTFEREDPAVAHTLESVPHQITNIPLPYKLRAKRIN